MGWNAPLIVAVCFGILSSLLFTMDPAVQNIIHRWLHRENLPMLCQTCYFCPSLSTFFLPFVFLSLQFAIETAIQYDWKCMRVAFKVKAANLIRVMDSMDCTESPFSQWLGGDGDGWLGVKRTCSMLVRSSDPWSIQLTALFLHFHQEICAGRLEVTDNVSSFRGYACNRYGMTGAFPEKRAHNVFLFSTWQFGFIIT